MKHQRGFFNILSFGEIVIWGLLISLMIFAARVFYVVSKTEDIMHQRWAFYHNTANTPEEKDMITYLKSKCQRHHARAEEECVAGVLAELSVRQHVADKTVDLNKIKQIISS